ncbi:MAG: AI-2E family transporter [Desulfobacter postgatei]|uniref:AI-2E family transporter n=1 Tax=Desulfobacter postgatei TaxID=2293 RepID=A0A2G6MQI6_9BACT|nr:MAG: AI-2E family transporter [Desulfobacter postgatei]
MERNNFQRAVFFFFLALFCISIFLVGKVIAPFFASLLLGIVIAGIFRPVFKRLDRYMPARAASVLTCLAVFFIVFIPVVFFVGILSREALGLYNLAKDAVFSKNLIIFLESTRILERINEFLTKANIQTQISWRELLDPLTEVGKNLGLSLFEQARFLTSNLLNLILYFCLMLIVIFYMFIDGQRLMQYIYDLSPLQDEHDRKLYDKFNDMAGAVLIGNGLGGFIQGVSGGALFWFLGLNSPFIWGVVMGFLAFLPIVGIGVVMLPVAVFFLLKGSLGKCLFIVGFYAMLSWGIEYIFKPRLVGDRVSMHPLVVFFAIIGGLKVYGILGIIYGPLIATLFLTLSDIYFSTFQFMVEPDKKMLDS